MSRTRHWLRFVAHGARGAWLFARASARSKLLRDHDGAARDAEQGVVAMGEALAVAPRPEPVGPGVIDIFGALSQMHDSGDKGGES